MLRNYYFFNKYKVKFIREIESIIYNISLLILKRIIIFTKTILFNQ